LGLGNALPREWPFEGQAAVPVSDLQVESGEVTSTGNRIDVAIQVEDDAYSSARGYAPSQMSEVASRTHRTFFLDSQRKQSYKGNTTARSDERREI
jgi:hypothetical protein